MTSSKSSSWLYAVLALLLFAGVASADRKRIAVLDFEGDEAEAIQKSFSKFLKKSHTVIKAEKWNAAAEELGATKINEKNVKKVAKKLKVDGIITGNVEKRRDEYIIRIKLRAGSSGNMVGSQVLVKTDEPKLSKSAKGDIEDELFASIDGLESVRGGGGEEEETEKEEEEEEKPSKFGGKQMKNGEEEEEKPKLSKKELEKQKKEEEAAKKAAEKAEKEEEKRKKEEEAAAKKEAEKKKKDEEKAALATKKDKEKEKEETEKEEEEEEEEESPLPKSKKGKKRTAAAEEEEEEGIEEEGEVGGKMDKATRLSPGNRAVDVVVGLSLNMRRLSFTYDSSIGQRPAGYKGKFVPGAMLDLTVYPLAFGHNNTSMLKNIGATAFFDQVLIVKSQDMTGKELQSAQSRYAIGAVFRYPFNNSASSPVIGARLRVGKQAFKISQPAPLPNVNYTVIDPGVFFRYPIGEKIIVNANASFLAVPNTGQIQNMDKYGAATVSGFEFGAGADYRLFGSIFVRGLFNFESIRYSFKGNGVLTDQGKVKSAADNYYGLFFNVGYLL